MLILLFSMLTYWTGGTPITSLTNPDYHLYNSPYNYNYLQIGAGAQNDGFNMLVARNYMINNHWIINAHYQNKLLNGANFPNGKDSYSSKFNQSDFSVGMQYRLPINESLDMIFSGELGYDWFKEKEESATAEELLGANYDEHSVGVKGLVGLRYGITDKFEIGIDLGGKYAYDRTYLQISTDMNYYFTQNISLGGKMSYDDHNSQIGLYIRVTR